MLRWVLAYVAAAICLCALDGLWLGAVARNLYRDQLGSLLRPDFRLDVAAAFYAVYLVGLLVFAVLPAVRAAAWTDALLWGALFGFFTYFTYDMTNLATLSGWPPLLCVVDIGWGVVVNAAAALAAWHVAMRIAP